jgi:hypothetical protein
MLKSGKHVEEKDSEKAMILFFKQYVIDMVIFALVKAKK